MNWRYQPVYEDDSAGRCVSLCECNFDGDGKLQSWTEKMAMQPMGETLDELRCDLTRMLADAYKWEPVPFDSLHVGMTFQRTGVEVESMISAMNMARMALGQ